MTCPCPCPDCQSSHPPHPPPTSSVSSTPSTSPSTTASTTPSPLLHCKLNCYGDASTPVPLPGGDGHGVEADTIETCRDFCYSTEGCEGVVFGEKMCWGKKDIRTSKCQQGDGYITELRGRGLRGEDVLGQEGHPHLQVPAGRRLHHGAAHGDALRHVHDHGRPARAHLRRPNGASGV